VTATNGSPAGGDAASADAFHGASQVPQEGTKAEQPGDTGAPEPKEHGPGALPADGLLDALGHLQTAALSMVAAARAAIDAAEQLVRDPKPLLDILADAARAGSDPSTSPDVAAAPPRPRVEHIAVRPPPRGDGDDEPGHDDQMGAPR
jgi:hypothetical protein